MNYDGAKATPLDERDVTHSKSRPVRQCVQCHSVVSPQFVPITQDEWLCQACWRLWDDRRNSYGDVA